MIDAPIFPDAACTTSDLGPDAWFPVGPEGWVRALQAIAVCRSCPSQGSCAEWATARPDVFGIWGGTTERQRRDIRWRGKRQIA